MSETLTRCPVCDNSHIRLHSPDYDGADLECGSCGFFRITGSALPQFKNLDAAGRKKIFQWIYEQQLSGEKPEIHTNNFNVILSRPPKSYSELVAQFLIQLDKQTSEFGQWIPYFDQELVQASGTFDNAAYPSFVISLQERGLIKIHLRNDRLALSPSGFEQVEKIRFKNIESSQGFVAMWFDQTMEKPWVEGFEKAVLNSGYTACRIDRREHINKICDEIISEIRKSRFVVADYTGDRGGVYYEAGFGYGLGLPIINTCRKDWMTKLHFDIRQYNCIDWESEADLAERLQVRIEANVGVGPKKTH